MPGWQPRSVDEVLDVLARAADDELIGVYESRWLDFKGDYQLSTPRDQWEFAKDVAAMARIGGVIIVGVQTERDPSRDEEFAQRVRPVPHNRFDVKRAMDIVERDVYPTVIDLTIEVYPREDRRLVAIVIPPQNSDDHPFLVSRFVDEGGQRWNAFAAPRRSGSHTVFEKIGTLHRDLADARRLRSGETTHVERPTGGDELSRAGDAAVVGPEHLAEAEQWTLEAADTLERLLDLGSTAMFYLAAVPAGSRRRPSDFFAQDGIRSAMTTRDALRQSGFGITYGINIQVAARSLLSVEEDRTLLLVEDDGRTIAGAVGGPDFLGWAQRGAETVDGREAVRVNVVALNEYVYEFCRFRHRALETRWGAGWSLVVAMRRVKSADRPLTLPTGYRRNEGAWFDSRAAEADERVEAFPAGTDPALDAARALEVVYGVFGLSIGSNPFITDGLFDEQKLLSI